MSPDGFTLAGSDVTIPLIGVGTWAWGDQSTWGMGGYDTDLTRESIREAWDASIDAGVTFFDTAEVYGRGESERIIGSLLAGDAARAASAVVATKFMPSPWKLNVRGALLTSLRASLGRLGLPAVDLYQIHGPISLRSHDAIADALAAAHGEGLVKAVGVSNYSVKETRSIAAALDRRGLRLATNQIEFSLLRRSPETTGLLAACADLGVVPLAYSPIGQGGRPPSARKEELLEPPDGGGRQHRRRAPSDRRRARGEAAQPGGAQLGDRQGRRPHSRCEEPASGRGERRGPRLAAGRRRPRQTRPGRPEGHLEPVQPGVAARLSRTRWRQGWDGDGGAPSTSKAAWST
jgi:aryl-alcohol dehydrogenase-like predicted oxidoreductase